MIPLELQILIAIILDLILGDPSWFPHPVRGIGLAAEKLEKFFRSKIPDPLIAGGLTWISILAFFSSVVILIRILLNAFHPLFGDIFSIAAIYFSIAAKDMAVHGKRVFSALKKNNLKEARKGLSFIVSRDVSGFDKKKIILATVESIAENIIDGITAPIFFAIIGGPAGAVLYRSVNTMDSMFGYKNEEYIRFGKISARADDIFTFLPARITSVFICIAAFFSGNDGVSAFKILLRDHANSISPNSGFAEAPVAGALKIRLGGPAAYSGKIVDNPYIGDDFSPINENLINKTIIIMYLTLFLFSFVLLSLRLISRICLF